MSGASGAQRNAMELFVFNALNAEPPAVFPIEHIHWTDQDFPPPKATYCAIDFGDDDPVGAFSEVQETGTSHANHRTMLRDLYAVVCTVSVFAVQDKNNPTHDARAGVILGRVAARVMSPVTAAGIRAAGLAPQGTTGVKDLSRYHKNSHWQTVAELVIPCMRTSVIYEVPGTIDRVQGTGTLTPAGGGPIIFDAEE